ncbi:MAG TPA: hypothetical protein PLY93_13395, partial [Turneriella sp.]|nr:hypothetical protein [Turneriella sp.]
RIFDSSGAWQTTTTNSFGEFIINGTFAHPPDRIGSRAFASDVVTGLSISTADLRVGMLVKGTSLPVGTKIIQILSANSVRLSDQSTATVADNLQFMRLNDVEITKSGYTGATEVSKQIFQFGHDGSATCPATPYNLDTNINACGVTDVGPVGAKNCTGNLVLYPIGIFAPMGNFKHQIKQTYEKFLTEKAGLTISARTGSLVLTSGAQRNLNFDGFYLHFDDTPKALPNVPEGKWSNHVPVNAMSTKCTPTVTTNCSPRANGVFAEGIGDDTRATPWGLKTYVYYNFYAAAAGSYTIQTTGGTDTQITLYAQTGANMGSDDDSGSGSNAKMTLNLLRGWYYIKVFPKNNNTFGFFDVEVTGPTQDESNYSAMLTPTTPSSVDYQTVNGTASYQTNCAPGNGNLVLSWYNHTDHLLYIAAPGENGGCNAKAWLEKHDAIGGIIRGRFEGVLRPIAPGGSNQTIPPNTGPGIGGFFNIVRME